MLGVLFETWALGGGDWAGEKSIIKSIIMYIHACI